MLGNTETQHAWMVYAETEDIPHDHEDEEVFKKGFVAGRNSVIFPPHSEYRDTLRQMICEGDFDFTKILEEIEFEGETYADISSEGADNLADYFIGLMEMIDELRSEAV